MTILVRALYKYYSEGRRAVGRPRRQWIEATSLRMHCYKYYFTQQPSRWSLSSSSHNVLKFLTATKIPCFTVARRPLVCSRAAVINDNIRWGRKVNKNQVGVGKKTQHERFSFIKLETGVSNVIHLELPWKLGVSLRYVKYHSDNVHWGSYKKWRYSWWRHKSYDFRLSKDRSNGRDAA